MHWTKLKFQNKERAVSEKLSKSYGSCALQSQLMRSMYQKNFIAIGSIVLEICSRQNSSMKISKKLRKDEL